MSPATGTYRRVVEMCLAGHDKRGLDGQLPKVFPVLLHLSIFPRLPAVFICSFCHNGEAEATL